MREQKRMRDQAKKQKMDALTGGNSMYTDGKNISNAYID